MESAVPVAKFVADPSSGNIGVPTYSREHRASGIVHFGVGGFHRAHQAMFVDRLLSTGLADGWAICGMGVLPFDIRMRDVLNQQAGLYTLVLRHPNGLEEARVIGSIVEYFYVPDDAEAAIEKLADPNTRIVSLTITEGGYNIHAITGEFDAGNEAILRDLADPTAPSTVFGLVVEALSRRRKRGIGAFTVMSCDNIPGNGDAARGSITAFARLRDQDLGDWIAANASFPNSMVDRITPATTDADIAEIAERFGVLDKWPVVAESFVQWVLEDDFVAGRPAFEEAGVQLVSDVKPYELMKLRLLNASHQGLAYFAALAGYEYVHEAVADAAFAEFLRRYMSEALPTIPPVPGVDLAEYCATLLERFGSASVRDTIARLAAETSDRIPKFLLPVVRALLDENRSVTFSAAIVASWARYAEGHDDAGTKIQPVDRLLSRVLAAAQPSADPLAFLRMTDIFGDLANEPRFTAPYLEALQSLRTNGAAATISQLIDYSHRS